MLKPLLNGQVRLPANEVAPVHAQLLMDSHVPADLERACRVLPLLVDPTTPFKVVQVGIIPLCVAL